MTTTQYTAQDLTRELDARRELGQCRCGCSQNVTSKRLFRPGHDARFVSVLVAATVGNSASTEVNEMIVQVGERISPALATKFARAYDNAERKMVAKATRLRGKAEVTDESNWVETEPIKVGRWTYPARTNDHEVQRNTKRDGSGEWVAV